MTTDITQIPAPRVPFFNPRTMEVSREWYRYFLVIDTMTSIGEDFQSHVKETRENFSSTNNAWHIICKGSPTISLQLAATRDRILTITNAGSGIVTVIPSGSDLVKGSSSLEIKFQWSTAQFCPYSGGYVII